MKKFVALVLIFTLIFGQISTPILVLAEEASSSAVESPTPSTTPNPSPSATPNPSPSTQPIATSSAKPSDPTPSPSPIASSSATPAPQPSPSPIASDEASLTASSSAQPIASDSGQVSQTERTNLKKLVKSNSKNSNSKNKKKTINKQKKYVEGEVLVKLKKGRIDLKKNTATSQVKALAERHTSTNIKEIKDSNIEVLDSSKTTQQMIDELKNDPDVEVVEPNYVRIPTSTIPNDPSFNKQWSLLNTGQTVNGKTGSVSADISATKAWDLETSNQPDVVIAVIDTGVAYDHADLLTNMWNGASCKDDLGNVISSGCPNHGWNYQYGNNDPYDDSGHGTHVSGTIAGVANNGVGISGLSSKNHLKIMAIKVGDWNGFYSDAIIEAINFAKNNGAKVINASYGGGGYSQLEKDTMASFPGLFIAAAGNSSMNNDTNDFYPANYRNSNEIVVAATDQNDNLAYFSDYGLKNVDVGAPGDNIYSTYFGSTFNELLYQDFETITPPTIPSGFTKTGDFGTILDTTNWTSAQGGGGGGGNTALYGDINKPYKPNANSTISSPTFNLAGQDSTYLGFIARCDTEYDLSKYTDYMALEFSKDGTNYQQYAKWDEVDLDTFNGESPLNPTGYAESYLSFQIPNDYLTNNFKFQFRWITNGSVTGDLGRGCFVDNLSLDSFSQSGPTYDYLSGTSMATPHVVGEAGMIMSYKPNLTISQVREAVVNSGDAIPALTGKTVSGKRINLYQALRYQPKSVDATLSNLSLSKGALSPSFSPSIATYSATVSNDIKTINVTPTAADSASTIKVNGVSVVSGNKSSDIDLAVGSNLISIVVTAQDNSTKTYTVNVTRGVDTIAPVITITRSPNKDINNGSFVLTVGYDDAVTKKYKVDNGNLVDYTGAVTVSSEGSHTFYAEGVDASGNKGSAQVSFTIDLTAPVVKITRNPDKDISNTDYTFTVDYGDSQTKEYSLGLAGVGSTKIQGGGGDWIAYTGPVIVSVEGSYIFSARGTDAAGNVTTAQTSLTIDKTAPVVTIDSPAENSRVSQITQVGFGMSGGSKVDCSIDNIKWISNCNNLSAGSIVQGGGGSVTLGNLAGFNDLADGQFTFYIRLTDDAGNIGSASRSFIKDTHIPNAPGTPTAEAGPIINSAEYSNGFSIRVPLQSDAKMGYLMETYLNADTTFTSQLLTKQNIQDGYYSFIVGGNKLGEDGVKTFTAKITDDLGRTSKLSNPLILTLDTKAPDAPKVSSIASDNKINASEKKAVVVRGTAEANSLVTVNLTDAQATISATLKLESSKTDYALTLDASNLKDGNIQAYVSAQDEAGNISAISTQNAFMDTIIPTLSYVSIKSDNPNPKMAKIGDSVTVTFTSSEALDERLSNVGINELIPNLVKNSDLSYSASRKILVGDPQQLIEFDIVYFDVADNQGTVVVSTTDGSSVTVDNTAPVVTGVENKAYNTDVTPTFNEGVATLNGIPFVSGTKVSEEGFYILEVTDSAGNSTIIKFSIDKTAPVLNLIRTPNTDVSNTDYTLAIEYSDANLNTKQYRLDNGNWADYSTPITVATEGNHVFEAKLTDLAGNLTQKQITFRVNKTVPTPANDSYSTIKNTPITIDSSNLLANDKDLDGDTLSVTGYSNAINGQALVSGTGVTFIPTQDFIGTGSFNYTVSDGLNTAVGTAYVVVTPAVNNNQTPIQPIVNINQNSNQVVVVNAPFDAVVNVPSSVSNATLDLSNLTTSTSTQTSATITGSINVNAATSNGNLALQLPQGLTISAPSSWTGTVNVPTILDNSTITAPAQAGNKTTTTSVVEIGFGDTKLTLSKAARIVIPGKKGQLTGYSQAGKFTPITTTCSSDDQTIADQLPDGGDCKIDVGSDLVIWTKHFTKFVTYTESSQGAPNNPSTGSSNSSSNGSSSSSSSNNNPAVCNDSKPGSAPTNLSAVVSGPNEITLTWSKAKDPVNYYLIAYGTKSGKIEYGNPNVGDKNTTTYTVKGLSGGTTYYFKVRAGNYCVPGEFSNEVKALASGSKINNAVATNFKAGVLSKQTSRVQKGQPSEYQPTIPGNQPPVVQKHEGIFTKIINFFVNIFKKH